MQNDTNVHGIYAYTFVTAPGQTHPCQPALIPNQHRFDDLPAQRVLFSLRDLSHGIVLLHIGEWELALLPGGDQLGDELRRVAASHVAAFVGAAGVDGRPDWDSDFGGDLKG